MHKLTWAFLIFGCAATAAFGLVVAVPVERLVDQAEIIVVGKVTKIEEKVFRHGERDYDAAVVEVAEVLKGDRGTKQLRIAQPGMGGIRISSDRFYAVGTEGVFMVRTDAKHKVHWIDHPSQFQPLKEKDRIAKLVKNRADIPGGKAVDGLQARAELVKSGSDFSVQLSLKNVSDKPITICTWVGYQPVGVDWTGPDGKKLDAEHYKFLERVRLRPCNESDFVTLKPGEVMMYGASGDGPILLPMPAPGQHKVVLSYTNKDDGAKFNLKGVWTGTATSNEVRFVVK